MNCQNYSFCLLVFFVFVSLSSFNYNLIFWVFSCLVFNFWFSVHIIALYINIYYLFALLKCNCLCGI